MTLHNKVFVITGGAQGLGFAMAQAFAAKGTKVALVDINEERLLTAKRHCADLGVHCCGYVANVAKEAEVEQLFEDVLNDFGALDGLINNAGIIRDGLLVKARDGQISQRLSLEEWQAVIDINLTGVFLCGREAATKMIEINRPGIIINISSISKAGHIGQSNYSAAKAGVAALTVTWSKELARFGIRCAGIAPGFIGTEMVNGMKPQALAKMTGMIPEGRLGEPAEIAQTAIYIAENNFINGRIIEIDGGMRL